MTSKNPESIPRRLERKIYLKVGVGLLLLVLAAWAGLHYGHRLPELERWISGHGALGYLVFIAVVVICTSLFVPDTVFALLAGVLFGLGWGAAAIMVASLLTACVDFGISRYFLGARGRRWLDANPKLTAIEQAATREGLPFLFMLRLTPISPVTVSYVLGVTRTRFTTFFLANFGLLPVLFVEVYFGYMAKHAAKLTGGVAEHSGLHLAVNFGGLAACVVFLLYVTKVARRALTEQSSPR
jgi:uncharacterized membrane protein YdjX (TVP38/TMEM64 family)